MTDKELRKLKRADLIELLYYLSRENDELRADNEKLRSVLYGFAGAANTPGQVQVSSGHDADDLSGIAEDKQ
ncbi:MAG: hypothetical protein II690_03920 [Ruminococcus sp.]|nr:hypothetical protein [Ruminococcus sp.]